MPLSEKKKPKFSRPFLGTGVEDQSEEECRLARKAPNEVEAEKHLFKAIELRPLNGSAYYDLAFLRFKVKKNKDDLLDQRIEYMEESEAKMYSLIINDQELSSKIGDLYDCLQTRSYVLFLYDFIQELLIGARYDEALAYCKKYIDIDATDMMYVRYTMTKLMITLDRLDEFEAFYEQNPAEENLAYADKALYYSITGQVEKYYEIADKLHNNPFLHSYVSYGNPLVEDFVKHTATYEYGMDLEEECDHFIHDIRITGLHDELTRVQALRSLSLIDSMNDLPDNVWTVFFFMLPLHITGLEPFTLLEIVKFFKESDIDELKAIDKEDVRSAIAIMKKEGILHNEGSGRYKFSLEAGDFFLGLFLWSAEKKGQINLHDQN